jgi:hypothetical protein
MSAERRPLRSLSAAEYEQMCREVRAGFGPQVMPEALLYALCKRVYHHAYGYGQDMNLPYTNEPRQEFYKSALRRLVGAAQSEPFDALEIAGRHLGRI